MFDKYLCISVLVAVEAEGYIVKMFYRSEICRKANAGINWQHGDKSIKNLGDIRLINEKVIATEIMKDHHVDFLIGTPPCNDFSRANPYRKGLDGKLSNIIKTFTLC